MAQQNVTTEPVALFAAAIVRVRAALAEGRDPEDAIREAYDLCADVRNLSRDGEWQDACNRFRSAVQSRHSTRVTMANLVAEGEIMLVQIEGKLPTVTIDPLDYWTSKGLQA